MLSEARDRLSGLPIGLLRGTREVVSASDVDDDVDALVAMAEHEPDEVVQLVLARWRAGDWDDLVDGDEGIIDLDRAEHEVVAGTPLGEELLTIGAWAIEMHREELLADRGAR
jgi:hypothetical protein